MAKRSKPLKPLKKGPPPGQPPVLRGDRLTALRLERKWSQVELAYRSGLSVNALARAELGKADLTLRGFLRVVEALEVDANFLLGRDGH